MEVYVKDMEEFINMHDAYYCERRYNGIERITIVYQTPSIEMTSSILERCKFLIGK